MIGAVARFLLDDGGQDLIEYALLGGLIGIAGVLVLPEIATRLGAMYANSVTGAAAAWEPCPPAPASCP